MRITVDGTLPKGVFAKDIILYIISQLTASGGTGHFIEYTGSAIQSLSMEGRMTVCNMSIEMGARGGMIAPDEKNFCIPKRSKICTSRRRMEQSPSLLANALYGRRRQL